MIFRDEIRTERRLIELYVVHCSYRANESLVASAEALRGLFGCIRLYSALSGYIRLYPGMFGFIRLHLALFGSIRLYPAPSDSARL